MQSLLRVQFTEQARRALASPSEVASALAMDADRGDIIGDNACVRQAVVSGFCVTYVIDDDGILVITARAVSVTSGTTR